MYILYIDEAGCPGALPNATSDIQPLLVLTGMILKQDRLQALTREFLTLKRRFSPSIPLAHELDIARHEMKGADLRRDIRNGKRNVRRRAVVFMNSVLTLLEKHGVQFLSRIYIKNPGAHFDGKAVYTSSVQELCNGLQNLLVQQNDHAVVIADSRNPALNSLVSHSIFTRKFQLRGDPYDRILEAPLFGHSENHAMLQIADFISSTLLYPIASYVYCTGHITSVHVHPNDSDIRKLYVSRLRALSYRFQKNGRYRGGITAVSYTHLTLPTSDLV